MKFELGQVVMTRGIAESGISRENLVSLLDRHSSGDWGELPEEDREMNEEAIKSGEDRILSSYMVEDKKVWIITEWNRSVTTIMFPDEY